MSKNFDGLSDVPWSRAEVSSNDRMFDMVCDWICKEGLNKHTCVETVLDLANAIRRLALEEAAKVCDDLESRISKAMLDAHERNGSKIDGGYLNACDDCAETIRALAASDSDGGKDE